MSYILSLNKGKHMKTLMSVCYCIITCIFFLSPAYALAPVSQGSSAVENADTTGNLEKLNPTLIPLLRAEGLKDEDIEQKIENYRHIGISMGGTKLAVGLLDKNNTIVNEVTEFTWVTAMLDPKDKSVGTMNQQQKALEAEKFMAVIADTIKDICEREQAIVPFVSISLAGPVDEKTGKYGVPFAAPNIPAFDNYPFQERLEKLLSERGLDIKVGIMNDAKGALMGETYAPEGSLIGKNDGTIVILGTGANIASKQDNDFTSFNNEILEGGHNLVRKADGSWQWVGAKAQGHHPIEAGNTDEEIIRKSSKEGEKFVAILSDLRKLGLDGDELLAQAQKRFHELDALADFPVIRYDLGERDVEDTVSGSALEKKVVVDFGPGMVPADMTLIALEKWDRLSDAAKAMVNQKGKETAKAMAIEWIQEIGKETGRALAAFIAHYKDQKFVENIVLVSSVSEKIGKGVVLPGSGEDVFMHSLQKAANDSLINDHSVNPEQAGKLASGIVRSKMNYTRELAARKAGTHEVLEDILRVQKGLNASSRKAA